MARNNGTTAQRRKWGRSGGKIGGRMRARLLTPERKSEIARIGAAARWAKVLRGG
jgi:hypothetical protein